MVLYIPHRNCVYILSFTTEWLWATHRFIAQVLHTGNLSLFYRVLLLNRRLPPWNLCVFIQSFIHSFIQEGDCGHLQRNRFVSYPLLKRRRLLRVFFQLASCFLHYEQSQENLTKTQVANHNSCRLNLTTCWCHSPNVLLHFWGCARQLHHRTQMTKQSKI